MDINDIFGGQFLKASDLSGRKIKVQISKVDTKDFDNGKKIILGFHGKEKGLAVNKTNARMIASSYGTKTEGWVDKEIILYPTKVLYQDQMVDAIRVEMPMEAADEKDIPF